MADRETVIGWLQGLAEDDWRECYSDSEVQETARQALDLIDELLKKQEAVKPEVDYICGNIVNVCGNCKSNLIARVNFCSWCGQAVKWE